MGVRNAEDYGIVIGINGYPQLRPLDAAERNATDFADWLRKPEGGGLPPDNVRLILSPREMPADPFDARPIQSDIDRALRDFGAERRQRIGRRLYFYFAGHGFGPDYDNVGMLMANAAMGRLKSNIGLRPYRRYLYQTPLFDEAAFILDCCRDPAQNELTQPPVFSESRDDPMAPVSEFQDFVILAAPYGEKAFEPADPTTGQRTGLLTQAVLEALTNPDLADGLGQLTNATLSDYVGRRVQELAQRAKVSQIPYVAPPPRRPMVFAITSPVKVRVRIVAPPGLTGNLVVYDNRHNEVGQRPAANVTSDQPPWEIELDRNLWYSVEHSNSPPSKQPLPFDLRAVQDTSFTYEFPAPLEPVWEDRLGFGRLRAAWPSSRREVRSRQDRPSRRS